MLYFSLMGGLPEFAIKSCRVMLPKLQQHSQGLGTRMKDVITLAKRRTLVDGESCHCCLSIRRLPLQAKVNALVRCPSEELDAEVKQDWRSGSRGTSWQIAQGAVRPVKPVGR